MARIDHHSHAARAEHAVERVGDFRRQPFLDLQAPAIGLNQTRELGNPDHAFARHISDMHAAADGRHVMLARAFKRNVTQYYDIIIAADVAKRAPEDSVGILVVTRDHARRRLLQAFAQDRRPESGSGFAPPPPLQRAQDVTARTRRPNDVWIVDGPAIRFGMPWPIFPFPTRMTVVRLGSGHLFIHSPTPLTEALKQDIERVGEVRFIIGPSLKPLFGNSRPSARLNPANTRQNLQHRNHPMHQL